MLRLVIGMTNYTGIACGISYEASIGQNVPEDWTKDHIQVRRLLALFPGSTAEEVSTKASPSVGAEDEKVRADLAAAMKADEAEKVVEEVKEEVVEEDVEEDDAPDEYVGEPAPLEAGEKVFVEYKGEIRQGKIVSILESGVVRVKIKGDDANYRVLDDDKVYRHNPETGA